MSDKVVALPRRAYTVRRASDLMGAWGTCLAIYGPPGVGKSSLAVQAADAQPWGGKVGVLDAEGGARAYGDRDDIDVFSVKDSDATHLDGMGYTMCEQVLNDLVAGKLVPQDAPKYGTIIVDNVSEINAYCTYDTLRTYSRNVDRKDRPDQKDWNTTTSRMLLFLRRWRDFAQASGTNVIFIAWDKTQEDQVSLVPKKDIALNPALARQLPGLIDVVAYLTIKGQGRRHLLFEATASTATKFRRAPNEAAQSIPGEFEYAFGSPHKPMVDLLACMKGGVTFPAAKYVRQDGRAGQSQRAAAAGPAVTDVAGQIRG